MSPSLEAVGSILEQVSFPGTAFLLRGEANGLPYLQVEVAGHCNISGLPLI